GQITDQLSVHGVVALGAIERDSRDAPLIDADFQGLELFQFGNSQNIRLLNWRTDRLFSGDHRD
ncbi:MAG: hypothetical protein OXF88_23820, partial [Rhodobacteraceae bacterium]|nr:hypothetical protein [Paracoccaceae bacterium]